MPFQRTPAGGPGSAAPTRPPISACDDDEGMPKYQVIRFPTIAPAGPANPSPSPLIPLGALITPLPTVAAPLPPKNDPTRLPTAAMASATRGVSARVETEVAIAFAASWNPLV